MALRSEIPRRLETASGRKFEYRVRCAWGGNHVRRRDAAGALLRRVAARSSAAGKVVDNAIDGYRPHSDPLNASYPGWWQSTGRPLRPLQSGSVLANGFTDTMLADDFTDADNTALASHAIAPTNSAVFAWTDPNSRWKISGNAVVRNGAGQGDASSSVDLGFSEYDLFVSVYVDNASAFNAGINVRLVDYNNLFYVRLHSDDSGRVDLMKVLRGTNYGSVAGSAAWAISVGWHSLVVKVRKSGIKVWVGNTLCADYRSATLANATRVGFDCAPTCSPKFDSFRVWRPLRFYEAFADWTSWTLGAHGTYSGQAAAVSGRWGKLSILNTAAPYSEDFEAYPVNEAMTSHSWVNYNHDAVGQFFKVISGKYGSASSYGTGGAWTSWRYEGTGALAWADYTAEFDVKATASGRFNFCVRYTTGGCYTVQGVLGVANELKLWHSSGNNPVGTYVSTLASANCPATVNHVAISCVGNRIRVTIDGNQLIDYTDASNLHTAGSVGVMTYAAGWTLDNLVVTPANAVAGYTGLLSFDRLTKAPISRDSVFQFQLGIKKTVPSGSYFAEAGVSLSDTTGNDVSADQNGLHVLLRNSSSGTQLLVRKLVSGVMTTLGTATLGSDEYTDSVRVVFRYDTDFGPTYEVWGQKAGVVSSGLCSWMPELLKAKTFVRASDYTTAVEGYFRDFAVFPGQSIYAAGEVGFRDDFATVNLDAWSRSSRSGSETLMTSEDVDGEKALFFRSDSDQWCFAAQINECAYGDWVFRGKYKNRDRVNVFFCLQDPDPNYAKGYGVLFGPSGANFVKDVDDNGASYLTLLKTRADVTTPEDDVFALRIVKLGSRFQVFKDDVLVFDVTDATYSSGLFGYQSYNVGGFWCYWHELRPRGLQQPVQFRVDRPMIQNPSFEDWDDLDGVVCDAGKVPNSWKVAVEGSSVSRSADGYDGGYAAKLDIMTSAFINNPYASVYQRNVRILNAHRYRASFKYKVVCGKNTGPFSVVYDDECENLSGFDNSGVSWGANMSSEITPSCVSFGRPSSPPDWNEAQTVEQTIDVDVYPKVGFRIAEVEDGGTGYLRWQFGVRTAAGDVWLNDPTAETGEFEFDLVDDAGLSGTQAVRFVFRLTYEGGYAFGNWVSLDWLKVKNTPGLIGGNYYVRGKVIRGAETVGSTAVKISSPTENLVALDEWLTESFVFDAVVPEYSADSHYLNLEVSSASQAATEDAPALGFYVLVDQVMVEDVTGFASGEEPELAWTTTPVTFRGSAADREAADDWWKAGYRMPLNVIWRVGESFTWGLLDENGDDLFTSRVGLDVLPGCEWVLRPEWIQIDLGIELDINQVLYYPLYSNGVRWLLLTHGDANWSEHSAVRIMQGLATYSTSTRLDLELEEDVETRFVQVVVLDADTEGAVATCQQVELYHYSDESEYVQNAEGSSPDVSITMSRPADQLNSLPDAATASFGLNNKDQRYTPGNKFSPNYGPYKHTDGLGDIRAGVPVRISMIAREYVSETFEREYESLMFLGSVGIDKSNGGALGIMIDGVANTATVDAVDFTVPLDQPVPVSELNPLENISAEETMRTLGYLAGIPRQDMIFDETGVTFPVVVFREQTFRENIQQLVQAIGGKFFSLRDGRLRYQNVAVNRSWTLTERQEFERGQKTQVDTQTVPGEFWADNCQWEVNHNFNVFPEQQSYKPWEVNNAASYRFVSNGELVVISPSLAASSMQFVRKDNYDKAKGVTLEWDVSLTESGGFNVWGYTKDVDVHHDETDYYNSSCAWRLFIYKSYSSVWINCGGQIAYWGAGTPLYSESKFAFFDGRNERIRVRVLFTSGGYSIYLNDRFYRTVPYCKPREIRWWSYESNSVYEDEFGGVGLLNGRAGDKNTTRDVWHDPNNRWRLDNYLHLNGTVDDGTTWLDFGCEEYRLKGDLYLDGSNAREGGWRLKHVDANNSIYFRVQAFPEYLGYPFHLRLSVVARVNGVETTLWSTVPGTNDDDWWHSKEGSQHFCLAVGPWGVRIFLSAYNWQWRWYELWREIKYVSFPNTLPASLRGSTKFAPYSAGGATGQTSWDHLKVEYGSEAALYYTGPSIQIPRPPEAGGGVISMNEPEVNYLETKWEEPADDEYVGKVVIGADPVAVDVLSHPDQYRARFNIWGNRDGYRLAYFRQKLTSAVVPIDDGRNGVLISQAKNVTAEVASWGIFEAETSGIGQKLPYNIPGLFDGVSNVDFFMQVSSNGVSWDPWVKVVPGEIVPTTLGLKPWVRWKAEFWRNRSVLNQWIMPNDFANYWKAHVKSVTLNWQIATAVTSATFRTTWNVSEGVAGGVDGIESNAGSYALGNPIANRVTALVNRWVEQTLTDSATTGAFWESSELPTILDNNDVYVINAEYAYPSKKGSGGTLRHAHVLVNGSAYTVNDGAGDVTCGNATVRFDSGQGVGTVTITAHANNTTINSLEIDAVCYKPASELYGTERVVAEDSEAQALLGRVIETEAFDNAFAMSRAIVSEYAAAELNRTKQYQESITGIQIPIMPSLSLENFGVVHNPIMGVYERQVAPTEITHQGFTTVISAEGVRTNESSEAFEPLEDLTPTGAWATHRLEGCASDNVLRVRSDVSGNEFDVYDIQPWFPLYKLSADGDWISAVDDDLRVVKVYDQTGNGNDIVQATEDAQPKLDFSGFNGWPTIVFDGADDELATSGAASALFGVAAASAFAAFDPDGDAAEEATVAALPPIFLAAGGFLGLHFGKLTEAQDRLSFLNNDGSEDHVDAEFQRGRRQVAGLVHGSGTVTGWLDGAAAGTASSGNTASLAGAFKIAHDSGNYANVELSSAFAFNSALPSESVEKLSGWMQAN